MSRWKSKEPQPQTRDEMRADVGARYYRQSLEAPLMLDVLLDSLGIDRSRLRCMGGSEYMVEITEEEYKRLLSMREDPK